MRLQENWSCNENWSLSKTVRFICQESMSFQLWITWPWKKHVTSLSNDSGFQRLQMGLHMHMQEIVRSIATHTILMLVVKQLMKQYCWSKWNSKALLCLTQTTDQITGRCFCTVSFNWQYQPTLYIDRTSTHLGNPWRLHDVYFLL